MRFSFLSLFVIYLNTFVLFTSAQLNPNHWFLTCGGTSTTTRTYVCNGTEAVATISTQSYNVSNCHFINCTRIYVQNPAQNITLNLTNIIFEGTSYQYGGALRFDGGVGILNNVTFLGCSSNIGAGLYISMANVTVTNSKFLYNTVSGTDVTGGAGIYAASDLISNTLICTDSLFEGNVVIGGLGGGAIYLWKINTILTNLNISGNSAIINGGGGTGAGILFQQGKYLFQNMLFYNNTAGNLGGGFEGENSQATCINCNFVSNFAFKASAFLLQNGVTFVWQGGSIINQSSPFWAAGIYMYSVQISISDVVVQNLMVYGPGGGTGGVFFLNGNVNATITNLTVNNVTATVQGGFAYLYGSGNLISCHGCNITQASSGWIGGIAVIQSHGQIDFYNSFLSDISQQHGALYITDNSNVTFYNHTTIQNSQAIDGSFVSLTTGSRFLCQESSILHNGSTSDVAGCIDVGSQAYATLDNCLVDTCYAPNFGGAIRNAGTLTLMGSTVIQNVQSTNGGLLYTFGSVNGPIYATTIFQDNVQIVDADAVNGGAVFADSFSITSFQDNVSILNSSATNCGGAIYSQGNAEVDFINNTWRIFPNLTIPGEKGQFICANQNDISLLKFLNLAPNQTLDIVGSIWIGVVGASQDFIRLGLSRYFAPSVPIFGGPTVLAWYQKPDISPRGLQPGETIPVFSVQVLDRWGHVAPVTASTIVVVQATVPNETLGGEVLRACLDWVNSTITYPNLALVNASPGIYNLSITPVGNTLSTMQGDVFPSTLIRIAICNADELFDGTNGGFCYPIKSVTLYTRIIFAAAGCVLLVIVLLCSLGIYTYRDLQLVKGSAPLFLILMNAGVFLMGVALIAGIDAGDDGCIIRAWFENLGFLTIFVPLLLKTKRIQFIFQNDWAAKRKHSNRLRTDYLLRNLGIVAFVAVALMVIWTVLDTPRIGEDQFYSTYVVVGRCRVSQGDLVAVFIRIGVLLYAIELAISVRNAPSNYNESKVIGFSTYNWAVFIGIGSSVAEFAIDDPEVAFIITSIAIFVPCFVHTILMTGYKVYKCYLDPEASNVPTTGYMDGGGSRTDPNASGSRLQAEKGGSREKGGGGNSRTEGPRSPTKDPPNEFFYGDHRDGDGVAKDGSSGRGKNKPDEIEMEVETSTNVKPSTTRNA